MDQMDRVDRRDDNFASLISLLALAYGLNLASSSSSLNLMLKI